MSSSNITPGILAAHAAESLNAMNQVAYVYLSPSLRVLEASPNLIMMIPDSIGRLQDQPHLTEMMPLFVGMESIITAVSRGEIPQFRLEHINYPLPDGTLRYLTCTVTPLMTEHSDAGLLLLIEDTTKNGRLYQQLVQERNELKLARQQLVESNEQLLYLSHIKSLFLSIAAHDMRSPLTSVIGFSELLYGTGLSEQQASFVQVIEAQAHQLNRLITNVLDLEQIEQDKMSINPVNCSLDDIITEVTEALMPTAQMRNMTMSTQLQDIPLKLHADPMRLRQILHNLLSNAIKYTDSGGTVLVSASRAGNEIELTVSDNGHGMNEEELSHLFDLYYRTEEARRSSVRGTGLGLFIVKRLVESHNGRIAVTSRPGKGTTFVIHLPALTSK